MACQTSIIRLTCRAFRSTLVFIQLFVITAISTYAQPQWLCTNGPFSGFEGYLAQNDDYVFYHRSNGLFRTADGGFSWQRLSVGLPDCYTAHVWEAGIAVHDNHLLLVLNDVGKSLYYSADHGDAWVQVPYPAGTVFSYTAHDGNAIYLYNQEGLFIKSSDLGQTWAPVGAMGTPQHIKDLQTSSGMTYVQLDTLGLFRSSDSGENWEQLALPFPDSLLYSFYVDDSVLFAYKLIPFIDNDCYRSLDGGETWELSLLPIIYTPYRILFIGDTWYTSNQHFLKSEDKGLTWEIVGQAPVIGPFSGPIANQGDTIIVAGLYMARSTDGLQTFIHSDQGLAGGVSAQVEVKDGEVYVLATKGVYKADPVVWDWADENFLHQPGDNNFLQEFRFLGDTVVARNAAGQLFRSSSVGQMPENITPLNNLGQPYFIGEIEAYAGVLYARVNAQFTLLKSEDQGDTWQNISGNLSSVATNYFDDFHVNGSSIFAAVYEGIFRSDDGGQTWSAKNNGLLSPSSEPGFKGNRVLQIDDLLFAQVNHSAPFSQINRMFRSMDNGENWQPADSGIPFYTVRRMIRAGNYLIAETGIGLFLSPDDGIHWMHFDQNSQIFSIASVGDKLLAGIYTDGLWETPAPTLVVWMEVNGIVFSDSNNNGIKDTDEPGLPNQAVQTKIGLSTTVTGADGEFTLYLPEGTSDTLCLLNAPPLTTNDCLPVPSNFYDFGFETPDTSVAVSNLIGGNRTIQFTPNPAKDYLFVNLLSEQTGAFDLKLIDATQQTVKQVGWTDNMTQQIQLFVGDVEPGWYLLWFRSDDQNTVVPVVITR